MGIAKTFAGLMKSGFSFSRKEYTGKIMAIAGPDEGEFEFKGSIDDSYDDRDTYTFEVPGGDELFATAEVMTKYKGRIDTSGYPMVTLFESKGKMCWIPWETYKMQVFGDEKHINLEKFTWKPSPQLDSK
ncbi:MAG: hypothetical protein JXC85_00285 [Candidatus Aenigmarchaeota archaeon]|nr:hypothetical protein [Candidatus Aenigmarchaeota archaeon]